MDDVPLVVFFLVSHAPLVKFVVFFALLHLPIESFLVPIESFLDHIVLFFLLSAALLQEEDFFLLPLDPLLVELLHGLKI